MKRPSLFVVWTDLLPIDCLTFAERERDRERDRERQREQTKLKENLQRLHFRPPVRIANICKQYTALIPTISQPYRLRKTAEQFEQVKITFRV